MKTYLVVLLALFVSLPATRAADDARIRQLITQLGDEDYKKREAATEELQSLGKAAEPQLKAAADTKDPEVRTRVVQLLQALEPPPADTGAATGRVGGIGRLPRVRGQMGVHAVEVRGAVVNVQAANVESKQQSAFEVDGKKYKVTRTEKNGAKTLTVVVTETKDGKDVTRTVEATDDDDLAKKDAELAKLVKQHAGAAHNEVQIQTGGQIIIQGEE
jgi:hypothetical protein